jgi:hypothetical protein
MRNINSQLPPSYIDESNIGSWLADIFDGPFGLPCICSDQTTSSEIHIVRPHIVRICQDVNSPSQVHITFHLGTAYGVWSFDPSQSGFSFDTTDGVDGIWHELRPDIGNQYHNPSLNNASLRGTDRVDASWQYSLYDPTNPAHLTEDPCVPNYANLGVPMHTFVFDMTGDHVDTWLSETNISFRLTFSKNPYNKTVPVGCAVVYAS